MIAEADGRGRAIFPVTLRTGRARFPGLPRFAVLPTGRDFTVAPPLTSRLPQAFPARRLAGRDRLRPAPLGALGRALL